jgi:hypothetical protein
MSSSSGISRRAFAESLAVAALAPLVGPSSAHASFAPEAALPVLPPPDGPALARALTEVVRLQYGSRLTTEDLETVRKQIESGLERAERVRTVAIANGDDPDVVFSAVRA